MQFDLRTVDPPGLDLAWVLAVTLMIASFVGLLWTTTTILRRRTTTADLVVWFAGLSVGLAIRILAPHFIPRAEHEGYYIVLFLLWLALSIIAGGVFLTRTRAVEKGPVGRWMVQGISVLVFGAIFLPAVLTLLMYAIRD